VTRSYGAVLGATGLISVATAIDRLDLLPTRLFASSPQEFADGRVWLLATSAVVADRPAGASIVGLAVVGLAAVAFCGARVAWLAAVTGQIGSALLVYTTIILTRAADPTAFASVVSYPDYGTSAVIAAWIGAIAYRLWSRGGRAAAILLCLASGLIGWLFKSQLTALDTEHVVALCFGIVSMRYASKLVGRRVGLEHLRRSSRAPGLAREPQPAQAARPAS
jgi:hypothetical protein